MVKFPSLLGSKPKWTDNGCVTVANGDNITCQCSHLTFFAVLLVCFALFILFVGHAYVSPCHISLTNLAVTWFATCKQRLSRFCSPQTPLNQTISSANLKRLTVITQVGCDLSVLFLAVVLFMHFLWR